MLATVTALALVAAPALFTTGAETPEKTQQLDLPPRCAVCPPGRVTCAWYPGFMAREVDLGDNGAEVLAIVPRKPKRSPPACVRERLPGEISLTGAADAWSGYFEGARGRFAFFRAEAPKGDAVPFTVYDTSAEQRVFTDEAIGPVRVIGKGDQVGIAFVRRAIAPCSPLSGGDACWARIRAELGVADPPPDCAAAYLEVNDAAARAACQGSSQAGARCVEAELRLRPAVPAFVPPALTYEVEIPDLEKPTVRATANAKVVGCRPPE